MIAGLATAAWCVSNLPAWWQYRRALDAPAAVQNGLLLQYVRCNAETVFGRMHDFAGIRSIAAYQARVPLMRYEDYAPLVGRVARGEPRVLTAEPVLRLAVTSGSTSAAKLIPYTATLQAEYARAVGPWIVDLYGGRPQLAGGPAYWSITPRLPSPHVPNGVVPTGFAEDSRYLGGLAHRLVGAAMAVPGSVGELSDHETHRYVTLLFLLRARELRLVSVWHPSYLTLLLGAMRTHWDSLLGDISCGALTSPKRLPDALRASLSRWLRPDRSRAEELRDTGPGAYTRIWSRLGLVSCWGDGAARTALDDLRGRLPGVVVQPKGLLATEAVVTLPFSECAGVTASAGAPSATAATDPGYQSRPLAICSHFFEFVDAGGRTSLAHELEPGATYEVVVTTGGGLYRYRLGDRVRVDGFVGRTPSLSFVGRDAQVSDAVGEKLHEAFVASVIARLFQGKRPPRFAMLAPERTAEGLSYTLFVETDDRLPASFDDELEAALCMNPHYALAVGLGQLAPSRAVRILEGFQAFAGHSVARGLRLGDVKPLALHTQGGWSHVFRPVAPAVPRDEGPCLVH